ncbi:DNA adenine methylase [Nitrosomonas sp. wSCUT-2]
MSTPNQIESPLRYPGSKATFLNVVLRFIETHNLREKEIVEPYAGSGIVSLSLVSAGIIKKAILIERDPLIYAFWKSVFEHTDTLSSLIENVSVNIDTWHQLKEYLKYDYPNDQYIPDLALACLFLNRTNFSGILHSGPVGGRDQSSKYKIDCRFNKKAIISRIQKISLLRHSISVEFGDALQYLHASNAENNRNCFFYVDPPYFKQGRKLYRYNYKIVDHKRLADVLKNANFPWILSYDKHEFIELLYDDFIRIHQSFRYTSKIPKNENELVITNMSSFSAKEDDQLKVILDRNSCESSNIVNLASLK